MRLSVFIHENLDRILQDWEEFARSIQPPHRVMGAVELRDHAEELLREIADDLLRPRSDIEKLAQSRGLAPARESESAAIIHATLRLKSGFTIDQLVAEYRALRTSVLHLWSNRIKTASWFEVEDITRFNEEVDRVLSESVIQYSKMERKAQDIFIGILGHDIRTPLNAISMGAETLMRTASLDSKCIQVASRILNSSARIGAMVSDVLDFTHARFGMRLTPQASNIGLLAEQVIEEIRSANPDRAIVLRASGDLDGTWDSGRISQVLSNLVNNALQHGSSTEAVSVSLGEDGDKVVVAVHNAGTPIPEEEIGHIFEPLHHYTITPRSGQRAHANLGLGLYIAREAVIAHGGTISVVSTMPEGTTFTIQLPKRMA